MYEYFEHTADFGLRVQAANLNSLFADAAAGLFAAITPNLSDVRPVEEVRFSLPGEAFDELLRDWLAELLYAFHARRILFSKFDVDVTRNGLEAAAFGEPIDSTRHKIEEEIKAVTWHGLKLESAPDGFLAEVIFDI